MYVPTTSGRRRVRAHNVGTLTCTCPQRRDVDRDVAAALPPGQTVSASVCDAATVVFMERVAVVTESDGRDRNVTFRDVR